MISSPGLRVPEPLTQLIPTTWRDVRQPFESLDLVPNLSTIRFELDISLLVYQPLNYITVTLDTRQLETKEYMIYSRLGQQRTAFWMALPSTGDTPVHLKTSCSTTSTPDGFALWGSQMNITATPLLSPIDLFTLLLPAYMMMPYANSDYL